MTLLEFRLYQKSLKAQGAGMAARRINLREQMPHLPTRRHAKTRRGTFKKERSFRTQNQPLKMGLFNQP